MASLKETKQRIASVQGTKKVTSAMKMVSSAKLHKAQNLISNMLPYQQKLESILFNFLSGEISVKDKNGRSKKNEVSFISPYISTNGLDNSRQILSNNSKSAVVVFSSNSSLCGSFNYNIIKEFTSYILSLGNQKELNNHLEIYPIGKKIEDTVYKMGLEVQDIGVEFQHLAAKPNYQDCVKISSHLMQKFKGGAISEVTLIYHHFKSPGVQVVTRERLLPIDIEEFKSMLSERKSLYDSQSVPQQYLHNYIVEPSVEEVISSLIPLVLMQKMYTALADSFASEHAARTMAMQVATDNAEDLISQLTILYNKSRQQAITAELLDIIGGSTR